MKPGVEARLVASQIVGRVLRDGGFSNVVIRKDTADLADRDRRLVQHLVYTVLRQLPRIDRAIGELTKRSVEDVETQVLDVLRVGAADILLTDTTAYAAVDSAVEAVRASGRGRASGFVNGVLRSLTRAGEPTLPDGVEGEALQRGVPPWILERLSRDWESEEAMSFLDASLEPAPLAVRLRGAEVVDGDAVAGIAGAFVPADPGEVAELVSSALVAVADPASTAVGIAVDAQPGELVLDVAAAPGGKTLQLWDAMGGKGQLVAGDSHRARLARARKRLDVAGASPHWVAMDGRRPAFGAGTFDKVLLDAPCTGLGTLRRRPEIKHRIAEDAPGNLAELQRAMLEVCLPLVRDGGSLVYSVCTVFAEETVEVVEAFDATAPVGLPGRVWGKGLLLAPHLTGTDGMFISVIRP